MRMFILISHSIISIMVIRFEKVRLTVLAYK
jgi:hypothetical protein